MKIEQHQHFATLARAVADTRDKAAFTELFDYFAPRLNSYLRRLSLEAVQAEEITQEVMMVLWHKAQLFDPAKSSLSTWLFRVARNRRIDLMRRDRSSLLDPNDPILQPDEEEPADDQLDAERRDARIREALKDLPEGQLDLVKRAFFLGQSHSEISDQTGLPLGTVKSRIRLAFTRLRKALDLDSMVDTDF